MSANVVGGRAGEMDAEAVGSPLPETDARTAPSPAAQESLAAEVSALRESGAWKADPARFRFLETLTSRMASQPSSVQAVLAIRLRGALDDFLRQAVEQAPSVVRRVAAEPAACTLLADLNAHLQTVATQRNGPATGTMPADPHELASVRRFRQAWETARTLERLEQALARSPANAGPLNSHALVVRSLRRMGDASTDYVRRFLAYAETLQWLEAARPHIPREAGKAGAKAKPVKKPRARK